MIPIFDCVALSDRLLDEQFHLELVTRFVVFRTTDESQTRGIKDIGEFLSDEAVALAQRADFPFDLEERAFRQTFQLLHATLEDNAFRRYDRDKARFVGAFLISAFEAIALGIGANISNYNEGRTAEQLGQRVRELWSDAGFLQSIGSGTSASSRIPRTIPLGRRWFA
jgi:hypothetical protein